MAWQGSLLCDAGAPRVRLVSGDGTSMVTTPYTAPSVAGVCQHEVWCVFGPAQWHFAWSERRVSPDNTSSERIRRWTGKKRDDKIFEALR
eukprot:4023445-Pyramimonas_sp.AAC.1